MENRSDSKIIQKGYFLKKHSHCQKIWSWNPHSLNRWLKQL